VAVVREDTDLQFLDKIRVVALLPSLLFLFLPEPLTQ
jgi:hypothetical protein